MAHKSFIFIQKVFDVSVLKFTVKLTEQKLEIYGGIVSIILFDSYIYNFTIMNQDISSTILDRRMFRKRKKAKIVDFFCSNSFTVTKR